MGKSLLEEEPGTAQKQLGCGVWELQPFRLYSVGSWGSIYAGIYSIYSPPAVDIIWGIWKIYDNVPKAIFYLLKGDYMVLGSTACRRGSMLHWNMRPK